MHDTLTQATPAETRLGIARRLPSIWRIALLCGVVLVTYAEVLRNLVAVWWKNPDFSHGFFVPVLAGYFAWQRRDELAKVTPRPSWWGLLLVIGSLGLLFLGSLGAELFLARISFVGVLGGLVLYFGGWPVVRIVLFPLCFLVLMVPLPAIIYYQIVFPLQLMASSLATSCLQYSHLMPVLREGNILVLPNTTLEVVEACSGIRSLLSLVTLAAAYGALVERSNWVRALLVVAMLPVAVLSNSARVLFTAIMSQWIENVTEGPVHFISGIVLFIVSLVLLLAIHAVLRGMARRFAARTEPI
ncbi:MAG: exosortase [Terriglobales bacterium]